MPYRLGLQDSRHQYSTYVTPLRTAVFHVGKALQAFFPEGDAADHGRGHAYGLLPGTSILDRPVLTASKVNRTMAGCEISVDALPNH